MKGKRPIRSTRRRAVPPLKVHLVSFGFKFGLPAKADMILDVRFLKNPFYVPSLKNLDGTAPSVKKFVLRQSAAQRFIRKLARLLKFLVPFYQKEGKSTLTLAFGCTGGKHRSVALVEEFSRQWKKRNLSKFHRDKGRTA